MRATRLCRGTIFSLFVEEGNRLLKLNLLVQLCDLLANGVSFFFEFFDFIHAHIIDQKTKEVKGFFQLFLRCNSLVRKDLGLGGGSPQSQVTDSQELTKSYKKDYLVIWSLEFYSPKQP